MANTEIFLRNIFGTTRPNIRPLVLALNITNDLLFEQHISMSDIKATKHIYPDVARLLHKKPETVYKSVTLVFFSETRLTYSECLIFRLNRLQSCCCATNRSWFLKQWLLHPRPD